MTQRDLQAYFQHSLSHVRDTPQSFIIQQRSSPCQPAAGVGPRSREPNWAPSVLPTPRETWEQGNRSGMAARCPCCLSARFDPATDPANTGGDSGPFFLEHSTYARALGSADSSSSLSFAAPPSVQTQHGYPDFDNGKPVAIDSLSTAKINCHVDGLLRAGTSVIAQRASVRLCLSSR